MLQSLILMAMLDFFLSTVALFCVYHSKAQIINALTILAGTVVFCVALVTIAKGVQAESQIHQVIRILIVSRLFSLLLFETHWQQKAPQRRPQKSQTRYP